MNLKLVNQIPVYHSVVLLVDNIEESKDFYSKVLGQRIVMDFGRNVGFKGGFALWEKEYALNIIFKKKAENIRVGKNDAELYFESPDLNDLYERTYHEKQ